MARVRLLHWKASEAETLLHALTTAGHSVDYEEQFRSELMRIWRKSPPDVFVIDLSRLPSHGREIAIALRRSPATRSVPVVFCQGHEEKVSALRALLPDAEYSDLADLNRCVQHALKTAPAPKTIPVPIMDRYANRTSAQKLGIRTGSKVALLDPPRHVQTVLGAMPDRVEFVEGPAEVTLCFLHDPDALRQAFSDLRAQATETKLWMLWQKKTSSHHCGITEPAVRNTGASLGLVDYKICSVDKNWSAMLFAGKLSASERKTNRPARTRSPAGESSRSTRRSR
jgi:CheY-like chemotaxis protein